MVHQNFFVSSKGVEDWRRRLSDPEKQWKTGFSAKALARSWEEEKGIPESVENVFLYSEIDIFRDMELLLAIPEYKVELPGGTSPSQNDVFVLGKFKTDLVVIMVEGKVSEPFGENVSDWFKNPSEGKKERLGYLCDQLNLEIDSVMDIRYQLLHRAVSALLVAKRFNAAYAMMMVHSFSQKDEWFDEFNKFGDKFNDDIIGVDAVRFAKTIDKIDLYLAWVRGDEKYLTD